jgi:hypothetical protein
MSVSSTSILNAYFICSIEADRQRALTLYARLRDGAYGLRISRAGPSQYHDEITTTRDHIYVKSISELLSKRAAFPAYLLRFSKGTA